jgi:hypothetical protein
VYPNKPIIYPIEKIVAVLSYYTFGFAGLLYLIIALIKKQGLRPFLRYHVFMSIFISILIYIVSIALIFIINILGFIPFVRAILFSLTVMFQSELISFGIFHFSLVTLLIMGLLTYLSVGAVLGKYTYLPWVSEVINYNMRQ